MSALSLQRQRGIAIIMAVLMAALVAGLAFIMVGRERLWMFQLENRQDSASAQSMALGAINLARLTIRDDGRNNSYDHLAEPWNTPIPAITVEEGKVAGLMAEAQGRFNLTNLTREGKADPAAVDAFKRLLTTAGVSSKLATDITAALEKQIKAGDQDNGIPAGQLVDQGEYLRLPGFTPDVLRQLEPYVVALPLPTALNVNFVSPEVLSAVVPDLTLGEAQRLLAIRASKPFQSAKEFVDAAPEKLRGKLGAIPFVVQSEYFLITIESWFGRVHVRYQALVRRNGKEMPIMVWLRRI